jgi:phosphate:Na+ symporter
VSGAGAGGMEQGMGTAIGSAVQFGAGLALFLFGLDLLTRHLGAASSGGLRRILSRAARAPRLGFGIGVFAGLTIQTAAATAMLVGFVHAGLLSLSASAPVTIGANLGTTLAVQVIAINLGDYRFLLIAAGSLLALCGPRLRDPGLSLFGFGLLFLGMETMSGAIYPYREALAPVLARLDGGTVAGLLLGSLAATLFTALIRSSGAALGITFALVEAGAITRLEQAYPIVIGANIGTCVTAVTAGLGTGTEARRAGFFHLVFNLFGGLLGLALAGVFYRIGPRLGGGLVSQIAMVNTLKMLITAVAAWPLTGPLLAGVRRLVPGRGGIEEASHLDERWIRQPEDALTAVLRETRRAARLCLASHRACARVILQPVPRAQRAIRRNEEAMNRIKQATSDYLDRVTARHFSKRQAHLAPALDRTMDHLERIHDHLDAIRGLSAQRYGRAAARFFEDDLRGLFDRYRDIGAMLARLERALDPEGAAFGEEGRALLALRDAYVREHEAVASRFHDRVAAHACPPISAVFFADYLAAFQRMVQHVRAIALLLAEPAFRLKPSKRGREEPPTPPFDAPPPADVDRFLKPIESRERCQTPAV